MRQTLRGLHPVSYTHLDVYKRQVTNSGSSNTFTIQRTGGTDGKQTVYYRTVNGSAIGGTHFTHAASSVVFEKGVNTQTVTVAEKNATTPFKTTEPATAYSNADRTYQLEIYRVDGGATIDASKNKATRTIDVYKRQAHSYSLIISAHSTRMTFSRSVNGSSIWNPIRPPLKKIVSYSGAVSWIVVRKNFFMPIGLHPPCT